jgi:hypothetical protein
VFGEIALVPFEGEKPKSRHFSFKDEEWESKLLPIGLRKYLSMRRRSYHIVPNDDETIGELEEFIDTGEFVKDSSTRLLRVGKYPKVFISFNSEFEAIDKKIGLVKEIRQFFIDEFYLPEERIDEFVIVRAADKANPEATLLDIKQCEYFICLLSRCEKASFSVMQLGWSIAYCASTFLIHEEYQLPKIQELKHQGTDVIKKPKYVVSEKIKDCVTDSIKINDFRDKENSLRSIKKWLKVKFSTERKDYAALEAKKETVDNEAETR